MARRRTANLPLVFALLVLAAYGGMVASSPAGTGSAAWPPVPPRTSPVPDDPLLYEAVSPAHREAVVAATAHRLSRYTISAELHPPGSPPGASQATPAAPTEPRAAITGTLELRFVNDTGADLPDLYLRLYPNLRQYAEGGMVVRDIRVDDTPIVPEPPPLYSVPADAPVATPDAGSADLILLRLPLPAPLGSGGAATVRLGFTTTVPVAPPDDSGRFRYVPESGAWTLAHWFPILAGYNPASGWELDPPAAWSDPTFSNTALYDVTLTAPADLVLVTTGSEVAGEVDGDRQVRRFVGGPVRDFVIVADPGLVAVSTEVNGTTVTSYHTPGDAAGGEQILAWGAQALTTFTELFGPYPYGALDLVAVPGVTAYEYPQLIFVGADYYPDPVASGSRPGAIEFLVAYEVAHQWWYGLVGSNPHRHAFLDEGLAEYSAVLYFERQHGAEAAEAQLDAGLTLRYATMLLTDADRVVDQPTAAFPDPGSYYTTVYRKAGLGFAALRHEIGDEAFFAGLRRYAETMRFGVATPEDLRAAFEAASDRNLDAFWRRWFETAGGRVEIVMAPSPATPAPATPVD
jgi:hypothetical protein